MGFDAKDRVVVLHLDDLGMSSASIAAYRDLLVVDETLSGSAMVPCDHFSAIADLSRNRGPTRVDLGIHLTLISEWDQVRWRPLSVGSDDRSGLTDSDGFFWSTTQAMYDAAPAAAVEKEVRAQIDAALSVGVDVTHLDSHVFVLLHSTYLESFLRVAEDYRLPPFVLRQDETLLRSQYPTIEAERLIALRRRAMDAGVPFFDHLRVLSFDRPGERLEQAREALETLPPGLTYFLFHPSHDTPEARSLTPEWRVRVADYDLLRSESLRKVIAENGVQVVGCRAIRDAMRASS